MTADAQFWDKLAERYARKPLPNPDSTRRKLDVMRSYMSPQDVVLDIGCGTGTIALELSSHASHVQGLDISEEMIKIARGKALALGISNIDFRQGTVEESLDGFEPESFAGVSAFNILHLTPAWPAVLQRIFAVLQPGGYFVSSTGCIGDSLVPYRPLLAVLRWVGKAPAVAIMRKDALLQGMQDAGFTDLAEPDVGAGKTTAFVVARKPKSV